MDNYVKMCSLLEPLQATKDKNLRRIIIPLEDSGIGIDDGGNVWVVCPDLDQLIAMLGKLSWRLKKMEVDVNKYSYEAWTWAMKKDGFWAGSPQKALIQLVAYELYGLTWDDKGVRWE